MINRKTDAKRGMLLAIPAVLFLFHPAMGLRDCLPDCIGYLLLSISMLRLCELNEKMEESLGRFRLMVLISAAASLLQYYCYTVLPNVEGELNAYQIPMLILLGSFALCVLQCWILVPAWRDFFLGLGILAERHGCERLLRVKRNKSRCERMASYSALFFTLQAILTMLPELSALTSFEYAMGSMPVDWYSFSELLRILASIPLWVMGGIWLIRFCLIWIDGLRDRAWMERLEFVYREQYLPHAGARALKSISFALSLIGIGAAFSVDLKLDDRVLLPSFVCAILLTVGVLLLGRRVLQKAAFLSATIALGLSGVAALAARALYLAEHLPEDSVYQPGAYREYFVVRLLDCAVAVFAGVSFCLLLRLLWSFCKRYVAVDFGGEHGHEASARATAKLQRLLRRRFWCSGVLFVLAGAAMAVHAILHLTFPWLWSVSFGGSLIAVLYFLSLLRHVREALANRAPEALVYHSED